METFRAGGQATNRAGGLAPGALASARDPMRYELLLQPPAPDVPFPQEALEAALRSAGVTDQPSGGATWRLKSGEAEVRPLLENGKQVAIELRLPLTDRLELVRELVAAASEVASLAQVALVDLQLNRAVTARDVELVAARYAESARYAGEMLGVPEAIPASFAAPVETGLKPGTKVFLTLAGLFLLALFLVDLLA